MLVESKQTLTEQEQLEANQMIALWYEFIGQEQGFLKFQLNSDEVIAHCYARLNEKSSGVSKNLRAIVSFIENLGSEIGKLRKEDAERCGLPRGPNISTPWLDAKLSALIKRSRKNAERNPVILPILDLILATNAIYVPGLVVSVLGFLNQSSEQLENMEADLRQTQRKLREELAKKMEDFRRLRGVIFGTLTTWVGTSSVRQAYLRQKGINVVCPIVITQSLATEPVQNGTTTHSLRRQKREFAKEANSIPKQSSETEPKMPWRVCCVNPQGSLLAGLPLLSEELAETFDRHYGWAPNLARTLRGLQKLVNTEPNKRNTGVIIRFAERAWFRLKVGKKYRIMAHIKDDERLILVMAGHRTELYTSIGQAKNEA